MKYILIALIFISCNSKPTFIHSKNDTTKTAALYLGVNGEIGGGMVFRVTKDTSYFDTINNETAKLIWRRDTAYYVPVVRAIVDTLGKPILDKQGKQRTITQFMYDSNKYILQDFNKSF